VVIAHVVWVGTFAQMRTRILILIAVVAAVGAGCDRTEDAADATPTVAEGEFALTGSTIDSLESAQPDGGFPAEMRIDDEDEVGVIAVRSEGDAVGLDDCDTVQNAYVVYYTPDTEFDPESVASDAGFPENLQGQNVSVQGEVHETDDAATTASPAASPDNIPDDCVIVADRVEVIEEGTEPAGTGGGRVDGGTSGSPSPSAGEEATPASTGDFPDAGIFDGPASPDPCEGAKACRDEPGIGQPGGSP
jgi:hypothetical protein